LLLTGGLLRAGSYRELMAEPSLDGVRLVAATLPGHARTTPPPDFTIGPVVLLGISLSVADEPTFLRLMDRLGMVTGGLPFADDAPATPVVRHGYTHVGRPRGEG
jgi:hypothetical protein